MSEQPNKLQIRAKVLSILSDLKVNKSLEVSNFDSIIEPLRTIEDKDFLFEILLKELSKSDELFSFVIKAILVDVFTPDIKERILDILPSNKYSDSLKYQLLQVLKDTGTMIEYEKVARYFEDFDSILDYDTKKLLETATVNPETQIDFLDFVVALPDEDKLILINSFRDNYDGDNIANILGPILYLNFSSDVMQAAVEILGESKSSLAIEHIKHLQSTTENKSILNSCKNSLNCLKLAGAAEVKAEMFYKSVLSYSQIHRCYATIPDGHFNQGFILSRQRNDDTCQMFAVVVNHIYGIVDCFGFNTLSNSEFERVLDRFCKNDRKISVSAEYCNTILKDMLELTKKTNSNFPYEFVCWNILLKDVGKLDYQIEEYAGTNLNVKNIDEQTLSELYSKDYLDKWFFTMSDKEEFKKTVESFLYTDKFDFDDFEKALEDSFELVWDDETSEILKNKIIITSHLLHENIDKNDAETLYSILSSDGLLDSLKRDILRKSVYEYFLMCRQNIKDIKSGYNIFKAKREKSYEKIDIKRVEEIISNIEKSWVK